MEKMNSNSDSQNLHRKTIERNRRILMKELYSKLASLIPPHHFKPSKEMLSQQEQLDIAASYIKQLKERVGKLKKQKEELTRPRERNHENVGTSSSMLSVLELRDLGSSIEVMLISGLSKNFMFSEVIGILEDEGAEVVSASFSTFGDKIFHSIHAQVKYSRIGVETARVYQRLQELIS